MSRHTELVDSLRVAGCSAPYLCQTFNWQPHTLRGMISQANTRMANAGSNERIVRKREYGVTYYYIQAEGDE